MATFELIITAELGIMLIADVYVAFNSYKHRGIHRYPVSHKKYLH